MKLLNKEREEISSLDLGILEAGKVKEYDFILLNESHGDSQDIKITIAHGEVEVISHPETLKSKAEGILKVEWHPSLTIKKGLQTLIKIQATELYR